jgi:hypothetical protein
MQEARLLASDGAWELWEPTTFAANQALASLYSDHKAIWDTAANQGEIWFNRYSEEGPLYVLVNKTTGEKYQIQIETDSFFDEYDHNMGGIAGLENFCMDKPNIAAVFGFAADVDATTDISASYSIPATNECVPYWQFAKADLSGSLKELIARIKDNLINLGFVSSVGTSGFESVNSDTIGVDVDVQLDKAAAELSDDEIFAINECGAELGGKNFEI